MLDAETASFEGNTMATIRVLDDMAPSPLERLVDDYLAHCAARGLSQRTLVNSYGYALHDVFLPWCKSQGLGDVPELSARVLDRFTSSLLQRTHADGRPISKHTVHSYVRPVRQMLTWAARVGEDVSAKPQLPRLTMPHRDTLSRDEIDLMERSVASERDKLIVRIFGDCGLRLDELNQLTPRDIMRSGRQAHLRVLGKGARVRDVPIPPMILRRLERHIESRPADRSVDRIFLSHRRGPFGTYDPLTGSGVYQVVMDAVARAGITKHVHPHLLRHSWMTEMLRQGMNPVQLSIIAGASLQVIQQHYTHLTKDDAYDAMMRILAAGGMRR
jgi:integrase/recombinase XerD